MFLVLTRELDSVLRYRLLNPISPVLSNDERYSVGSSTTTIEPLIAPPFPPLEISPSQGLFFIRQCSSASKRAYSTKTHAFLQYSIPKFKLGEIILEPLKGGGAFFHPPFLSDGVFTGYGVLALLLESLPQENARQFHCHRCGSRGCQLGYVRQPDDGGCNRA